MEGGVYMSNALFNEKDHLTKISLKAIKDGSLNDNELSLVLEHICYCEICAEAFANCFNDDELIDAPLGFEEEIQFKIKKKKEKDTQFLFYSLRVAIATSIALMIVFSNTLNFVANTQIKASYIAPPNLSIVNSINTELNNFSQKIIHTEVFNNEKKKK